MRYTCLTYDARQRTTIYATDDGNIVAVSDEELFKNYQKYTPHGLKATVLPPGTRHYFFYDFDPNDGSPYAIYHSHSVRLKRCIGAGWEIFAAYLAPWHPDEWVFTPPVRVEL